MRDGLERVWPGRDCLCPRPAEPMSGSLFSPKRACTRLPRAVHREGGGAEGPSSLQPWDVAQRRPPARPSSSGRLGAPGRRPGGQGGWRAWALAADGCFRSLRRPGPNRHEPGGRDPPQHFGGPPPLISPKPQHHSVPTALWNPVSLMDSTLETRRAPEGHPLHGHPAPFEPSRQAAVPLVKVERVYCPEKAEEGPRKREAAPLDKYQPPAREAGGLEQQAFPPAPAHFLAELEPSTQTVLGQPRAPLAPPAPFGETPGPLKPGSPYRPPAPRGPDPTYVYDEFLQQRRRLVSKLDLEERRRREAQEKGLVPGGRALPPPSSLLFPPPSGFLPRGLSSSREQVHWLLPDTSGKTDLGPSSVLPQCVLSRKAKL